MADTDDAFIDVSFLITAEEVTALLDSKLIDPKDAAARFLALSLALDPDVTDTDVYVALIEYDRHPELVSVAKEMGKSFVVETLEFLSRKHCCRCYEFYIDEKFRTRAENLGVEIVKDGSYINWAFDKMAVLGDVEAMRLIKDWGPTNYDYPLMFAALEGHLEAMKLLKDWGATEYDVALTEATRKNRLEAMKLLKDWGATDYDFPLTYAARECHLEAMKLLKDWGATDYDMALDYAAQGGHVSAMKLLKNWGATDFDGALKYMVAAKNSRPEVEILLRTWISEREPRVNYAKT